MELLVTAVGPGVKDVKIGMRILVDPNPVEYEGLTFENEGREFASVPEVYVDWRTARGYLFGVFKDGDE